MKRCVLTTLCALMAATAQAQQQPKDSIVGRASYYSERMTGRRTASGERFHNDSMMCAHLKYPFGTRLRVRNLSNGREVIVRVTDRGPYNKRYMLDLSQAAAKALGFLRQGHTPVSISVVHDLHSPYKLEQEEYDLPGLQYGEENDSLIYEPEWQEPTDSIPAAVPTKNAGITHKRGEKKYSPTPSKKKSKKKSKKRR